jgi:polysaccharide biosynthesis/export protein
MMSRVWSLFVCLALAACAGTTPLGQRGKMSGPAANVEIARSGVLPPPGRGDLFEQNRPYLIGPFDKLVIDVFGIEELSKKEVQTDAGGRISFPLAGIVEAAGKTPGEVEQLIEDKLRESTSRRQSVRSSRLTGRLKNLASILWLDG